MKPNPKQTAAAGKPTISAVPPDFEFGVGEVMHTGAVKYGRFNWREEPIKATTYLDAMRRHMLAWASGEDIDPESGRHHLYHVAASCAVVTDAMGQGTLVNDLLDTRSGVWDQLVAELDRLEAEEARSVDAKMAEAQLELPLHD